MSRPVICVALLSLIVAGDVRQGDAQVVRRIRERRAAALVPPIDPNAPTPPADATAEVPPPVTGGFFARRLQRRRDLVAQQAAEAQPTPASPALPPQQPPRQSPTLAQRQAIQALRQASAMAAPAFRALTERDLKAMEVPELQMALSDSSGALANELNRFTSAESWQGYLNLPSGIVDEGTIDVASLQTTLVRFENASSNPRFSQITLLPSFRQAKSILTELVARVDEPTEGPQLINPVEDESATMGEAAEELPTPTPEPQRQPVPRQNDGEHSILLRTTKG